MKMKCIFFCSGLVEMKVAGTHHIASTRNNDFSNRAQKGTITVVPPQGGTTEE